MSKFRLLQVTNTNIGVVTANSNIPLGTVTSKIDCSPYGSTFSLTSSASDTVVLNNAGYYKITYSITDVATDTGVNSISLIANNNSVHTVGETVATAEDAINLTLVYYVRVYPQCNNYATNNPMSIQIRADNAITSATANLIIEKLY